ncbi:hormogonium polysaccharide biosynthesis protein HpsL [Gloeothece verrucosa]|uniref:O-antigen polymerase n=1 Tax=Gloeothece verrucosa (strain PCC 7822) TaxID=497965 RepID=E0U9U8_GLOV7|nr:hormogonium polysaccharide biosynthesis protein HpsL [Gloeothece verrucosa]ADN15018.1 conserved hypothetical protein [Gloeothece verrucosa PCC 7822]
MAPLKKKKRKTSSKNPKNQAEQVDFKTKIAQKRQAREARKNLLGAIFSSIFCLIVFGIPLMLTVGVKEGIMVGIGIPILFLSYKYPRQALWVFLIYIPFGGTITYSIGGGSVVLQLVKDVFYIPALIKIIQERSRKRLPILIPKKIKPTLTILLICCFLTLMTVNTLQQFLPVCDETNPVLIQSPLTGELIKAPCRKGLTFLQGLFGLKVLLGYFPLALCAYYLIEDKKKLFFLGRLLVVLTIICCLLGLVQYWMLKSGRCLGTRNESGVQLYKASLEARCFIGGSLLYSPEFGQIRLPGTFVSPWHWGWFLVAHAAISYTVTFSEMINSFRENLQKTSLFWGIAGLISMILVLINAIICGQRLAFILVPSIYLVLLILSFLLLSTAQGSNLKQLFLKLKHLIPVLIGVGVFIIIGGVAALSFFNPDFIQERYESFLSRWAASNPLDFMSEQINLVLDNSRIFGKGLGEATSSARFLGDIYFLETYHAKIIYEIGVVGFFAFMGFLTHLLMLTFKAYRSVRNPGIASYGASFWVFMVIITYLPYWYPMDTDPVGVYYWFFAGVILKLPEIDKLELPLPDKENSQGKKLKFKRKKISWT